MEINKKKIIRTLEEKTNLNHKTNTFPITPPLSTKKKKEYCKPLRKIKRKNMSFTLPYCESLGDVKSEDFIKKLKFHTDTPNSSIEKAVVVKEIIKGVLHVNIAIGLNSKDTIPIGGFLWKLYNKAFKKYHYKIQLNVSDNSDYLKRARNLVAPVEAREMDMEPFVYGEELYELLQKIENSENKIVRHREISDSWELYPIELQQAALECNKNWTCFIESRPYKLLGKRYPFKSRIVFDFITMMLPDKDVSSKSNDLKRRYTEKMWNNLHDPIMTKRRRLCTMNHLINETN